MNTVFVVILLLCDIVFYLIIFDVIISWLTLFGIKFRPGFIAAILDPLYNSLRKIIPTSFGAFEFAPLVVLIIITLIEGLISAFDPNVFVYYRELLNF